MEVKNNPLFTCPLCKESDLGEDELWHHWPTVHGRHPPERFVCPICEHLHGDNQLYGDSTWGFGNHLFHTHGPPSRLPDDHKSRKNPTYGFSLVIIQHPKTNKFVLVEEGAQAGWWLPAGGVDPGEGFIEAAIREAKEEAGIDIELKGILAFENSPRSRGGGRQRMIFYAHPKNPDEPLKSIPDYESQSAMWISYKKLFKLVKSKKMHLRGTEPLIWFGYVDEGKPMYPLELLRESPSFH